MSYYYNTSSGTANSGTYWVPACYTTVPSNTWWVTYGACAPAEYQQIPKYLFKLFTKYDESLACKLCGFQWYSQNFKIYYKDNKEIIIEMDKYIIEYMLKHAQEAHPFELSVAEHSV